ncbi:hypothetical protein [Halococcus hamelinensis]|uniref:Uncharacterized protein n=1 Tax=Halococcus hamelinensis 100A6 TaxID=1132509 RepID=M0M1R4_9EURY|nr:hypothetical protein [Halococcus hamelinensis]EMA38345.1 hypothetical protein C447_09312 [Halococcus hamelinensis 100A6]
MNTKKQALLGQGLTAIAMVLLIYERTADPEPTAPRLFGVDWLVLVAVVILLVSLGIVFRVLRAETGSSDARTE